MPRLTRWPILIAKLCGMLVLACAVNATAQGTRPYPQYFPDFFTSARAQPWLQPDGRTLRVGSLSQDGPAHAIAVIRMNPDDTPDLGFGKVGMVRLTLWGAAEYGTGVVAQADGKILVGANAVDPAGVPACAYWAFCNNYIAIFRLNGDGTRDDAFNGGGRLVLHAGDPIPGAEDGPESYLDHLSPQSDGNVLLYVNPLAEPGPAWARLVSWGRRLTPSGRATAIRHKLDLAGNPSGWDVDRVLAFKMLGLLVGAALGVLLPLLADNVLLAVLLGVGLAAFGFYLPDVVLYQAAYNRSDQIRRELPDALDLLVVSVEAGLGFDAALAQVARNTHGPLADEFFRVLQEMQIGTGRSDAMRALGERTDVADLRGFVTSMVQADSFGIPVANVLRVQAREMRIKRSQRAEEAAQKVPVKILFPLIFCIMPALFIVIMGPAVIQIMKSFSNL